MGEHLPYKQRVIGSSPIVSSAEGRAAEQEIVRDPKPFVYGPVVQLVRTLACHARGQGFESPSGRRYGGTAVARDAFVAQLVEQRTENPRVVGSIPTGGTNADLAHLVERDLAKVEVAGSSPVIRSKTKSTAIAVLFVLERHDVCLRQMMALC